MAAQRLAVTATIGPPKELPDFTTPVPDYAAGCAFTFPSH
jgi:hypothetical protein